MTELYANTMADDSVGKHESHGATAATLYDALNKLQQWQSQQLREFHNRQTIESQRMLRLSSESLKEFEQLLSPTRKSSEAEEAPRIVAPKSSDAATMVNDLDSSDSFRDYSITGHLQRCFDDSSQSNISINPNKVPSIVENIPIFSEIRNSHFLNKFINKDHEQVMDGNTNNPLAKPKRPFLRKGSGLRRYMPKSTNGPVIKKKIVTHNSSNASKKPVRLPQKTLNLKSAVRKGNAHSEKQKHIRFDIPFSDEEENGEFRTESELSSVPNLNERIGFETHKQKLSPVSLSCFEPNENKSEDILSSSNEHFDLLKENKELEEFEMLEDYAQNTSFNSDSSVVQKYLSGDLNKPFSSSQTVVTNLPPVNIIPVHEEVPKSPPKAQMFFDKVGLNKCLEEIQARKEKIQKEMSEIKPRMQALERETKTGCSDNKMTDENEAIAEGFDKIVIENDSEKDLIDFEDNTSSRLRGPFTNAGLDQYEDDQSILDSYINEEKSENISNVEEESISEIFSNKEVHTEKSIFHEKILELQKEIENHQKQNARLETISKERDEILRKLQKEKDDFKKYAEAEKKKLESEIKKERLQLKHQKESFMRFQKFSKDHPTRKEREELNSLRQEIEKLQEELKREKIKYRTDFRKWKSRLEAAERDRDTFKLENIKLEEQCQDLLAAYKARVKKKGELKSLDDNIPDESPISKDTENQVQSKESNSEITKDSNDMAEIIKPTEMGSQKLEHQFNSCPKQSEFDGLSKDKVEQGDASSRKSYKNEIGGPNVNCSKVSNATKKNEVDNMSGDMSAISVSVDSEVKEIDYGNKKEKIFPSGEREIIFHSGTRKVISADGRSMKLLFYNGDIKEVLPDKQEIYRYLNGVTETLFPDGLKITEFPNGQTQHRYPSGQKEIRFPDSSVHIIFTDGSQEIHKNKGNVVKLSADGTKITEFANGGREIKTATYERHEFPDGSVKIRYDNGRTETRYSDGRIRIKDKEGKVLFDTKYIGTRKG